MANKYDTIELRYMILNYVRDIEDDTLTSDVAVYIVSKEAGKIKERNLIAIIYGKTDTVINQDIEFRKKSLNVAKYEADKLYVPNFIEDIKIYSANKNNIIDSEFYKDMTFKHYLGFCSGKVLILNLNGNNKKLIPQDKSILSNNDIISTFDTKLGIKVTGLDKDGAEDGTLSITYHNYMLGSELVLAVELDGGEQVKKKAKSPHILTPVKTDSHIKALKYNSTGNAVQEMEIKLIPKVGGGEYTVALPKEVYTLGSKAGSIQIKSVKGEDWKNRYNIDLRDAKLITPRSISISGEIESLTVLADTIIATPNLLFDNGGQINKLNIIANDLPQIDAALEKIVLQAVQDNKQYSIIGKITFITDKGMELQVLSFKFTEVVKLHLAYYTNDYLNLKYKCGSLGVLTQPLKDKLEECRVEALEVVKSLKSLIAKFDSTQTEEVRKILNSREKSLE